MPESKESHRPHGNSQDRESDCRFLTRSCPGEDPPHRLPHLPFALPIWGQQPLPHHVVASQVAHAPLTALCSSTRSAAQENTGTSPSTQPNRQPGFRKCPALLLTGSSAWRSWLASYESTSLRVTLFLKTQHNGSWFRLPPQTQIFSKTAEIRISIALAPGSSCWLCYIPALHGHSAFSSWTFCD